LAKKKTSVTLSEELLSWVGKEIEAKRFASVSHAVEYALEELRKKEKQ